MLEFLTGFIMSFIHSTGYFGIFFLMALGTALIPIPSEVVLPFTGFLVSKGVFLLPLTIIIAAVGDVTGSLVAYGIGYFLEETVMLKLIRKYGKFVLLSEHDYRKAEVWFEKYGPKIIVISKLLPGLRYLISLPAGVLKMDIKKFITYSFIGATIWSFAMLYIGVYLGSRWETIGPLFNKFRFVIIVVLILLIAFYIYHKLKYLNLQKAKSKTKIDKT